MSIFSLILKNYKSILLVTGLGAAGNAALEKTYNEGRSTFSRHNENLNVESLARIDASKLTARVTKDTTFLNPYSEVAEALNIEDAPPLITFNGLSLRAAHSGSVSSKNSDSINEFIILDEMLPENVSRNQLKAILAHELGHGEIGSISRPNTNSNCYHPSETEYGQFAGIGYDSDKYNKLSDKEREQYHKDEDEYHNDTYDKDILCNYYKALQKNEYLADGYAKKIGLGDEIATVLPILENASIDYNLSKKVMAEMSLPEKVFLCVERIRHSMPNIMSTLQSNFGDDGTHSHIKSLPMQQSEDDCDYSAHPPTSKRIEQLQR